MEVKTSLVVSSRLKKGAATGVGIAMALFALGSVANAQTTYRGNAYGANIGINATVLGVGARVVNANLPTAGSVTPVTSSLLDANVQAQGSVGSSLFTVLNAGVINSSTQGSGGTATSVTQITGLSVLPSLSINLLGLGTLSLGPDSVVGADLVRSTTTANATGNSGRTEITNLRFGATSLGNIDVANATSATYYLNLNGQVSANASTNVLVPDIVQLVINGQTTTDGGATRTTDAIRVNVLPAGQLASGNIVVASSTAGIVGSAVVPEANTLSLVGMGAAALGTLVVRRRIVRRSQS